MTNKKQQNDDTEKTEKKPRPLDDAARHFDLLPGSALVRQRVVEVVFGIGNSTLWRRVHDGLLPLPIRIGQRTTRWRVSELRAVLNAETLP